MPTIPTETVAEPSLIVSVPGRPVVSTGRYWTDTTQVESGGTEPLRVLVQGVLRMQDYFWTPMFFIPSSLARSRSETAVLSAARSMP